VNLGNTTTVHIGEIHNVSTDGVFDLIVYRSSATQEQTTPAACSTFANLGAAAPDSALILSHKADDDMLLPAGVGLTLQANQMLMLELHAMNYGVSPQPVSATSTLVALADGDYQSEAAFVFIGDIDIDLEPNSTGTTQGFVPIPDFVAGVGAQVDQLSGYTHAYGTSVAVATGVSPGPFTTVYDPTGWIWSQSPRTDAVPPAEIASGGGFQITCNYLNTSTSSIRNGPAEVQDEACFFQGYAHPASGAFVCVHSSGGFDECCPTDGGVGCQGLF